MPLLLDLPEIAPIELLRSQTRFFRDTNSPHLDALDDWAEAASL